MVLKKAKHGARTGNTQRKNPDLKSFCKKEGLIKKTVVDYRPYDSQFAGERQDLIDDGGISNFVDSVYISNSTTFSLNKKKRWLIPEAARAEITEELCRNEETDRTLGGLNMKSKGKKKQLNRKKGDNIYTEDKNYRTVLVQRSVLSSDHVCHTIFDTSNKKQPIKEGRKRNSHVADVLKDPENIDVKYEIEAGMQSKSWPYKVHSHKHKNMICKKRPCKQQYSWQEDPLNHYDTCMESIFIDNEDEEIPTWQGTFENEMNKEVNELFGKPTLGDFIIKKEKRKRGSRASKRTDVVDQLKPCNPASADMVELLMKNSMVHIDWEDVVQAGFDQDIDHKQNQNNLTRDPNHENLDSNNEDTHIQIPVNLRVLPYKSNKVLNHYEEITVNVASSTINEIDLREIYKEAYIEGSCFPRRFAIILQDSMNGQDSLPANKGFLIAEEMQDSKIMKSTTLKVKVFALQESMNTIVSLDRAGNYLQDFNAIVLLLQEACQFKVSEATSLKNSMYNNGISRKFTKWQPKSCDIQSATSQLCLDLFKTLESGNNHQVVEFEDYDDVAPSILCEICLSEIHAHRNSQSEGNDLQATQMKKCLHAFCECCWEAYLNEKIHDRFGKILCPAYKCQSVVDLVTIMALVSSDYAVSYFKTRFENAIAESDMWQWCSSCERLAFCDGFQKIPKKIGLHDIPVIDCVCKKRWCFSCHSDSHWPASCDSMLKYKHIMAKETGTTFDRSGQIFETTVQLRYCPFCRIPIAKTTRSKCKYMFCWCGNTLCWNCSQPAYRHHGIPCKKVAFSKRVFSSLDINGRNEEKKYLKKLVRYKKRAKTLSTRRTKLGLDRKPSQFATTYPENSKMIPLKNAIKSLCDFNTLMECVAVTLLTSKSRYYKRWLLEFLDSTEFMFNVATDTLFVPHVDNINFCKLNNMVKTLEATIHRVKNMVL